MACDQANRLAVADDGIGLVLQAMALCSEEALVQANVSSAKKSTNRPPGLYVCIFDYFFYYSMPPATQCLPLLISIGPFVNAIILLMSRIKGARALYNFVYRCEAAHLLASEEDALEAVEPLLRKFTSDADLLLLTQRTIRALQPDGWQGGADFRADLPR